MPRHWKKKRPIAYDRFTVELDKQESALLQIAKKKLGERTKVGTVRALIRISATPSNIQKRLKGEMDNADCKEPAIS